MKSDKPRLISKGSSSVLTSPRVDVGALNDGVGTLISVNDASTVDGNSITDAGSSTIGKPFSNNKDCTGTVTYNPDCTGTVTYNPDWTGTVIANDLCNRFLTGDLGGYACTPRASTGSYRAVCQT